MDEERALEKKGYFPLILLTTISITYFAENFLRSAAGALTPILIDELEISHGAMGLLISAYFFIYGIMQLPSGILSDRLGARKTILLFTILAIIGVFLFWVSEDYNSIFIAQILVGIGCSTFYINAVKLVTEWFPTQKKATAIGVLSASSGLGNFVSYMGFPIVVERYGGWRTLYLWMSMILAINWAMNIFIIKDKGHILVHVPTPDRKPIIKNIVTTLKDRRLYPFIVGFILCSSSWVFMNWIPQFLIEARGFSYLEVGQVASIGTIAGIPGCIMISAISDRLKKRKTPLLMFSILATILLIIFLTIPSYFPVPVFSALNFLIGFSYSYWVLYFSMIPETLPPEKAAIGLGVVNGFGTIGFSVITPIYGALVDITGKYYISNLLMQLLSFLVPVIFFFFLEECYGGISEK